MIKVKKIIFLILGVLAQCSIWAQKDSIQSYRTATTYISVNINTGDTVKYYDSGKYEKINRHGVKIVEGLRQGGISHPCGCMPEPNGVWIYKYDNGNTDSTGTYQCGRQINEWKYFYPNGSKKKIQSFSIEGIEGVMTLVLKKGAYEEFDENGYLATKGQFKIIRVMDSVPTLNEKTYNFDGPKVWVKVPKSVKSGTWFYYNSKGIILRKEKYEK